MRIELASLQGGKGRFSHEYSEGQLVLEDSRVRLISPPKVDGTVSTVGSGVRVAGQVVARVQVECDRCLKPVELPVDSTFKVEFVSTDDYRSQHETELSEEDLDRTVFEGDAIDIDALVAEEVLLAIPDHQLCEENCKGICPACGADRNSANCGCDTVEVDPRWAGLKELISKENS